MSPEAEVGIGGLGSGRRRFGWVLLDLGRFSALGVVARMPQLRQEGTVEVGGREGEASFRSWGWGGFLREGSLHCCVFAPRSFRGLTRRPSDSGPVP